MALEVYSSCASQLDCKKIVDDYLEKVGDMAKLLPKEVTTNVVLLADATEVESKAREEMAGETSSTKE